MQTEQEENKKSKVGTYIYVQC